jgi:hypothetical protein
VVRGSWRETGCLFLDDVGALGLRSLGSGSEADIVDVRSKEVEGRSSV